jgi:hypothetical protein
MYRRLVTLLSLCLFSTAAVAASATVVDPAGSRSNEHLPSEGEATTVNTGSSSSNETIIPTIGGIQRYYDSYNSDDEYDVTLSFLENKVWDILVVTDEYGLTDPMAIEEDDIFMKAVNKTGRTVHRASIQDESFDWRAGKSVVIRTAWTKVGNKEKESIG